MKRLRKNQASGANGFQLFLFERHPSGATAPLTTSSAIGKMMDLPAMQIGQGAKVYDLSKYQNPSGRNQLRTFEVANIDETTAQPVEALQYERTPNFISTYANNAYFESSAWDLKIIFGQLDQPIGDSAIIKQHIAVTVPWAQAKLALYYLRLHVEANEIYNRRISNTRRSTTGRTAASDAGTKADSNAKRLHELMRKVHAEFIASL